MAAPAPPPREHACSRQARRTQTACAATSEEEPGAFTTLRPSYSLTPHVRACHGNSTLAALPVIGTPSGETAVARQLRATGRGERMQRHVTSGGRGPRTCMSGVAHPPWTDAPAGGAAGVAPEDRQTIVDGAEAMLGPPGQGFAWTSSTEWAKAVGGGQGEAVGS